MESSKRPLEGTFLRYAFPTGRTFEMGRPASGRPTRFGQAGGIPDRKRKPTRENCIWTLGCRKMASRIGLSMRAVKMWRVESSPTESRTLRTTIGMQSWLIWDTIGLVSRVDGILFRPVFDRQTHDRAYSPSVPLMFLG